jgi:periplasmic copper chaperone A
MKRRDLIFALCALMVFSGCTPAKQERGTGRTYYDGARDPNQELTVSGAWARPTAGSEHDAHTPQGALPNGAIYLEIKNSGAEDTLLTVSGDVAKALELHESKDINGMMRMLPLPEGIVIPPRATVELKPAGKHIMLVDVKNALKTGSFFVITLTFKSGRVIKPEVVVQAP